MSVGNINGVASVMIRSHADVACWSPSVLQRAADLRFFVDKNSCASWGYWSPVVIEGAIYDGIGRGLGLDAGGSEKI